MTAHGRILALCGGVGGAKLVLGLSQVLPPSRLKVVVNTGDDFEHMGLLVCPDLDTVTYTLAGLVHPEQGWGRADESWQALETVERLGGETWFRLGDRDLGLHLVRRALLQQGMSLSEVSAHIAAELKIKAAIIPMSDDAVRTEVETEQGRLSFQHYFVREKCEPALWGIRYAGVKKAQPAAAFMKALKDPGLSAVVICPSNPFLSIDPILSLPGVHETLKGLRAPVIAVSPVVRGKAIKGPTAKIMQELGLAVSVDGIADHYDGLLDGLIIDRLDRGAAPRLEERLAVHWCDTVMTETAHKVALAREVIKFANEISGKE